MFFIVLPLMVGGFWMWIDIPSLEGAFKKKKKQTTCSEFLVSLLKVKITKKVLEGKIIINHLTFSVFSLIGWWFFFRLRWEVFSGIQIMYNYSELILW